MTSLFNAATYYLGRGYSVIPVRRSNKRSFVKWAEFQKRLPSHEELKRWFSQWPDCNIALITGSLSGLTVIDVDTEQGKTNLQEFLPDSLVCPIVKTPNGWHYWFKYRTGLSNKARVIEGTDIRTDGGYCIAPPSMNGKGRRYEWGKNLGINKVEPPEMPEMLFDILMQGSYKNSNKVLIRARSKNDAKEKAGDDTLLTFDDACLHEGRRDETIFHLANTLVKHRVPEQTTRFVLDLAASNCSPPFPKAEVELKIKSAKNRKKSIAAILREWICLQPGDFLMTNAVTDCHLMTRVDKLAAYKAMERMVEDGTIERVGKKRGHYRPIQTEFEFIDITNARPDPMDLWIPLGIHKMIRVYPGNILAIAGAPDSGKTAFCLSFCRYNFKKHRIRYLSSEMGQEEAADRIQEFDDITIKDWQANWEFLEVYDNYGDALLKGKGNINIIDYLEQPEGEAWRATHQIAEIHRKLDGAICLLAIQKHRGARETGFGGEGTLQKPRFYMSMDFQKAKIIKAKIPNRDFGYCTGMSCEFVLGSGHHFRIKKDWKRRQ